MGSDEDQHEMVPKDTLVRHSKDRLPSWRDSLELLRRCEDIILSLALRHRSYRIIHQLWHTPLCDVRRTWGLFWWKNLVALAQD